MVKSLIERQLAVKWMSASQPIRFFQIFRRKNLTRKDLARQIGRICGKRLDDRVGERIALAVSSRPASVDTARIACKSTSHVSRRRERVIQNRRNRNIQIRRARKFAVLRSVERAFEIINSRTDVNSPGQRSISVGNALERGESGQPVERQVKLWPPFPCSGNVASSPRSSAANCTGSSRPRNVRCGSAPETTRFAEISSPPRSTTPELRRSSLEFVPLPRPCESPHQPASPRRPSPNVRAPIPPRGNAELPTGFGSDAARKSSSAVEPADHGPIAAP